MLSLAKKKSFLILPKVHIYLFPFIDSSGALFCFAFILLPSIATQKYLFITF